MTMMMIQNKAVEATIVAGILDDQQPQIAKASFRETLFEQNAHQNNAPSLLLHQLNRNGGCQLIGCRNFWYLRFVSSSHLAHGQQGNICFLSCGGASTFAS